MIHDRPDYRLDVLTYQDGEGWVGHCLQLDLAECAPTRDQALEAIVDVVRAHFEFAIANDNLDNLFHAAPKEIWKMFFESELMGERTIELHVSEEHPFDRPVVMREGALAAAH